MAEEQPKVVFISGVWDILHVGHLWALEQARDMGDFLIVGVCTDEFAYLIKGVPTIPYEQRVAIISSIEFVDGVVPHTSYSDTTCFGEYGVNVRAVSPVFGEDIEDQRRCIREHKANGIEVIRFPWYPGEEISSTRIKEKIKCLP